MSEIGRSILQSVWFAEVSRNRHIGCIAEEAG